MDAVGSSETYVLKKKLEVRETAVHVACLSLKFSAARADALS